MMKILARGQGSTHPKGESPEPTWIPTLGLTLVFRQKNELGKGKPENLGFTKRDYPTKETTPTIHKAKL
jgi:hypothetical protein